MSSPSAAAARRWRPSPRAGSACAIPMRWTSPPARTICCSWPASWRWIWPRTRSAGSTDPVSRGRSPVKLPAADTVAGTGGPDAAAWLLTAAERGNQATAIDAQRSDRRAWTVGNRVTAHIDGAAYFVRLYQLLAVLAASEAPGSLSAHPAGAVRMAAVTLIGDEDCWCLAR